MLLIISIVLAVAVVVGIILEVKSITFGSGTILSLLCGLALFILIILWVVFYASNTSDIQKYYATKQTVEASRSKDIDLVERAALTQSIIEVNSWLSEIQYWNETIFDQAIPDEVMKLKPIK